MAALAALTQAIPATPVPHSDEAPMTSAPPKSDPGGGGKSGRSRIMEEHKFPGALFTNSFSEAPR
jgi:hypothetical protein